jgi:hypothetical protein
LAAPRCAENCQRRLAWRRPMKSRIFLGGGGGQNLIGARRPPARAVSASGSAPLTYDFFCKNLENLTSINKQTELNLFSLALFSSSHILTILYTILNQAGRYRTAFDSDSNSY